MEPHAPRKATQLVCSHVTILVSTQLGTFKALVMCRKHHKSLLMVAMGELKRRKRVGVGVVVCMCVCGGGAMT